MMLRVTKGESVSFINLDNVCAIHYAPKGVHGELSRLTFVYNTSESGGNNTRPASDYFEGAHADQAKEMLLAREGQDRIKPINLII